MSISQVGIMRIHTNVTQETVSCLIKGTSRKAGARDETTEMERKGGCLEAPIKFNVSNKWTISKRLA